MSSTPPEWPIRPPRPRPRTLWSDLAGLWRRFRGLPALPQLIVGLVVTILAVALLSLPFRSRPATTVAARTTTTLRTIPPTTGTTTTTKPLPAGDDLAVTTVIDGDSFEVQGGTKIRLIGVDAPDVETSDCFSAEATAHLKELIGPPRTVRLAYGTGRTDRYGRTLAYVYRLPDGLFVNVALAKDGFAFEQRVDPNTAHADEIASAVADARTANRGRWGGCPTTTTTAPRATTTAAPATTAPATTTTAPATTTSTVPASTTTTLPVVLLDTPCEPLGAEGRTTTGAPAVCGLGLVWRAV